MRQKVFSTKKVWLDMTTWVWIFYVTQFVGVICVSHNLRCLRDRTVNERLIACSPAFKIYLLTFFASGCFFLSPAKQMFRFFRSNVLCHFFGKNHLLELFFLFLYSIPFYSTKSTLLFFAHTHHWGMTRPEPRSQVCDKLGIGAWSLIPGFQENLTQYLDCYPN